MHRSGARTSAGLQLFQQAACGGRQRQGFAQRRLRAAFLGLATQQDGRVVRAASQIQAERHAVTVLGKDLKRQVSVDGAEYTVSLNPDGFRLTGKGKRNPRSCSSGATCRTEMPPWPWR